MNTLAAPSKLCNTTSVGVRSASVKSRTALTASASLNRKSTSAGYPLYLGSTKIFKPRSRFVTHASGEESTKTDEQTSYQDWMNNDQTTPETPPTPTPTPTPKLWEVPDPSRAPDPNEPEPVGYQKGQALAVITGVISLAIAAGYLLLVQTLDGRELLPPPPEAMGL